MLMGAETASWWQTSLNDYGIDGWELGSMVELSPSPTMPNVQRWRVILKRQTRETTSSIRETLDDDLAISLDLETVDWFVKYTGIEVSDLPTFLYLDWIARKKDK